LHWLSQLAALLAGPWRAQVKILLVLVNGFKVVNYLGNIMKKILLTAIVLLSAVGCASNNSNDRYERRADAERERQAKLVEQSVKAAPKWMTVLPESKDAVYANGSAVSTDMSMAADKAKLVAYGKICMAAGGTVDQRSSVFRADTDSGSAENSELAIRGICRTVDISGVEITEVKTIAEGNRYRSFVLVALPTGDANAIQTRRDRLKAQESAQTRSNQVFREMDIGPNPAQ
jgi:hypothetical protein